jgi:hypothetical protein
MVQAVKASLAVFRSPSAWLYPLINRPIQNLHLTSGFEKSELNDCNAGVPSVQAPCFSSNKLQL